MTDLDRHCGRGGCPCPHRDPCYQGFEDYYDATRNEWLSVFCAVCRPEQRRIVDNARDRQSMMRALQDPKRRMNPYPDHDRSQQWTGA